MVASLTYGGVMMYHSQSQKHYEQVVEIDEAITDWETQYKDEVKTWQPSLINGAGNKLSFEELNNADFHSQFSDLDNYTAVKYNIDDIKQFLVVEEPNPVVLTDNGEFNITTSLLVEFSDGQSLSLSDIPVYRKKKSPRSKKDCTLNRIGIWNATDNSCYIF